MAYLDDNSELMITPYAESISAENVYDIDWSILEDLDQLKYFIQSKDTSHQFNNLFSMDPRSFELHRKNKTSKKTGNFTGKKQPQQTEKKF